MSATAARPTRIGAAEELRVVRAALRPTTFARELVASVLGRRAVSRERRDVHVLDARYEPGRRCIVLYGVGDRLAVGIVDLSGGSAPVEHGSSCVRLGAATMTVRPFPHDPELPGLATALRPSDMAAALNRYLPGHANGGSRVVRCDPTAVRYRPARSCTVRVQMWTTNPATGGPAWPNLFGKVYRSPDRAAATFAYGRELATALSLRRGRLEVARPIALVPELPMVLSEPAQGDPLDLSLLAPGDARTERGVSTSAAALAELHRQPLSHPRQRPIRKDLERLVRRWQPLMSVDVALASVCTTLIGKLEDAMARLELADRPVCTTHGDCKPGQFLIGDGVATLLDFDGAGLADPARDVGAFVASMRHLARRWSLSGRRRSRSAEGRLAPMEESFLRSYSSLAEPTEGFDLRVSWYAGFALLQKARRALTRSARPELSAALLHEGIRCLDATERRP